MSDCVPHVVITRLPSVLLEMQDNEYEGTTSANFSIFTSGMERELTHFRTIFKGSLLPCWNLRNAGLLTYIQVFHCTSREVHLVGSETFWPSCRHDGWIVAISTCLVWHEVDQSAPGMVEVPIICNYNIIQGKWLTTKNTICNHHMVQQICGFTLQIYTLAHWMKNNAQSQLPHLQEDMLLLKHAISGTL